MKFPKLKKILNIALMTLVILGIVASVMEPLKVNAWVRPGPTYKDVVVNEPIILSFSTASVTSSSRNNGIMDVVNVALTVVAYPQSNPSSQFRETVYMLNNGETSFSRSMPVTVTRSDGITYSGTYSFSVYYNSKTASLKVNGSTVSMGSSILRNANVYPEARVEPSMLGVEMAPLPFSLVKAASGMSASSIEAFNQRINGGITQTINLYTEQFGTGASSTTKLSMYVNVWKRRPDGTYDKSQAATRVQVIYSAADLLNGVATHANWGGTQYYRQIPNVDSTGYYVAEDNVLNGYTTIKYFSVQNRVGWDKQWGYQGVVGNWSMIYTGTHGSSSDRRHEDYYKYSRYQIQCSNYWRTSYTTHWSPISSVGDAFCKNQDSSKPYFRKVLSTDTVGWTMAESWSGRTRTSTGYRYQTEMLTPRWGSTYTTTTHPSEYEITSEIKRVLGSSTVVTPTHTTVRKYHKEASTIAAANGLSEAGVNDRVYSFAVGRARSIIIPDGGLLESSYWSQIESKSNAQVPTANSAFKEGHNWGLYLYVTGHWRAIEVPISWYEISGSSSMASSLSGKEIIPPPLPDPDTETEIALTDFTYVQSVFDKIVATYPSSTLSDVQNKFMTSLSSDGNKAAQKIKECYDELIKSGKTQAQAYVIIDEDFNLNISSK